MFEFITKPIKKWQDPAAKKQRLQRKLEQLNENWMFVLGHSSTHYELAALVRESEETHDVNTPHLRHLLHVHLHKIMPPNQTHWSSSVRDIYLQICSVERKLQALG